MTPRITNDGDTRERIRGVALELFIEQGFERTSLREIADKLGFSKAALYYHYPSKSALVEDVVAPIIDSLESFLGREDESGQRPLREFLLDYFDVVWENRVVWLALTRDASWLASLDVEELVLNLYNVSVETLVGSDAPPYDQVRVHMAIGGLSRVAMIPSPFPYETLREAAVDAAIGAIGASGDDLTKR